MVKANNIGIYLSNSSAGGDTSTTKVMSVSKLVERERDREKRRLVGLCQHHGVVMDVGGAIPESSRECHLAEIETLRGLQRN